MKPLPTPSTSSIASFPERGPWGDARYPGNSSGFVMLELLAALKPGFVIDVTAGSGTNVALCQDYGVRVRWASTSRTALTPSETACWRAPGSPPT